MSAADDNKKAQAQEDKRSLDEVLMGRKFFILARTIEEGWRLTTKDFKAWRSSIKNKR
ncbi:hypothetical protein FHT92_005929 [Rhizobium sp. BK377]|jgi:hypothetical protein|nr:hypothetical protein [Rhizobium sp. BK377]